MSWMDVPTPSNQQSWLKMIDFVESMPDPQWTAWKAQLVPLLRKGIARGLDRHFLAGQSMQHILFSCIDRYGLEDEPRVTIAFEKGMELYVALSNTNIWFNEPAERANLPAVGGFELFKVFLLKLWLLAKPDESLPSELENA